MVCVRVRACVRARARARVCVCVCAECSNQTQNSETKNRKRRNSFITESQKKLFTGDKMNLLQKDGKSKIEKLRVKLYTKIIFKIRLMTEVKRNTFNKR